MSYPEPIYGDGKGEISATYRPHGHGTEPAVPHRQRHHYLATTHTTHGEFGLYRMDMAPRAGGPATHFHRSISESFFILDGTVRIYNGERWIDAKQGDFVYVPQGGLHAFRNDSDAPAVDAAAVHAGCAARGVLREGRSGRRVVTGGAGRVLHQARHVLDGLTGMAGHLHAGHGVQVTACEVRAPGPS